MANYLVGYFTIDGGRSGAACIETSAKITPSTILAWNAMLSEKHRTKIMVFTFKELESEDADG